MDTYNNNHCGCGLKLRWTVLLIIAAIVIHGSIMMADELCSTHPIDLCVISSISLNCGSKAQKFLSGAALNVALMNEQSIYVAYVIGKTATRCVVNIDFS